MRFPAFLILPALFTPITVFALPASDPVSPKGVYTVQPLDLSEARLLASPFKAAMERDTNYLLDLDADRLLHTFRLNAGLPSTAQEFGGWEAAKYLKVLRDTPMVLLFSYWGSDGGTRVFDCRMLTGK